MAYVSANTFNALKNRVTKIQKQISGTPIVSYPPEGKCRITNIYIDPTDNKTVIKWDDEIGGFSGIISRPPIQCCRITNMYVNPITEKMVVEYDK